jgi:hypothetical protein
MVRPAGGIAGHPSPTVTAFANSTFVEGAIDPRRIVGYVLELPMWEVTAAHNARATQIGSAAGITEELLASGPAVFALVLLVFAVRRVVETKLIAPLAGALLPPPAAGSCVADSGSSKADEVTRHAKTLRRFQNAAW